jgi:hypothetical protein
MPRKVRKKWYGLIAAVAARSCSESDSCACASIWRGPSYYAAFVTDRKSGAGLGDRAKGNLGVAFLSERGM